jgi:hypothetical protein
MRAITTLSDGRREATTLVSPATVNTMVTTIPAISAEVITTKLLCGRDRPLSSYVVGIDH